VLDEIVNSVFGWLKMRWPRLKIRLCEGRSYRNRMKNFGLLVTTLIVLVALPINTRVVFALGIGTVNQGGDFSTTTIPWTQQIGENDVVEGITADSSGVYVVGATAGLYLTRSVSENVTPLHVSTTMRATSSGPGSLVPLIMMRLSV
jgi:hypothetical protein